MCTGPDSLFLITYVQDGLVKRDSFYHGAQEAQAHYDYLHTLFPESQVELHEIPFEHRPETRVQFLEL